MKRQISEQSAKKSVLEEWPRLKICLSLSQRVVELKAIVSEFLALPFEWQCFYSKDPRPL